MPRKTIESIDSSKDKSSVSKIFEQITFVVRNPYGKDIVKKNIKKQKHRKERTKFVKFHFVEYNKLLQRGLLRFCVKGEGKRAFRIENVLVPPTQDYVNILKDLFCRNFLISVKSICNEKEAALV